MRLSFVDFLCITQHSHVRFLRLRSHDNHDVQFALEELFSFLFVSCGNFHTQLVESTSIIFLLSQVQLFGRAERHLPGGG